MRQLGELNKNGKKEFKKLGVEVVAVFREEKDGLAGLQKVETKTKVPFTLALDTPATATKAYSNGRKEFANYVVDKNGVIRGIIDGTVKTRARASKLIEIVKSVESDSAGSTTAKPADDQAAVKQAVMDYVAGFEKADKDSIKQAMHPDAKMFGLAGTTTGRAMKGKLTEMNFSQLVDSISEPNQPGRVPKAMMAKRTKVMVFDVSGNLASAKMTSVWGTALMQLVKEDGQWKILQILSQPNSK